MNLMSVCLSVCLSHLTLICAESVRIHSPQCESSCHHPRRGITPIRVIRCRLSVIAIAIGAFASRFGGFITIIMTTTIVIRLHIEYTMSALPGAAERISTTISTAKHARTGGHAGRAGQPEYHAWLQSLRLDHFDELVAVLEQEAVAHRLCAFDLVKASRSPSSLPSSSGSGSVQRGPRIALVCKSKSRASPVPAANAASSRCSSSTLRLVSHASTMACMSNDSTAECPLQMVLFADWQASLNRFVWQCRIVQPPLSSQQDAPHANPFHHPSRPPLTPPPPPSSTLSTTTTTTPPTIPSPHADEYQDATAASDSGTATTTPHRETEHESPCVRTQHHLKRKRTPQHHQQPESHPQPGSSKPRLDAQAPRTKQVDEVVEAWSVIRAMDEPTLERCVCGLVAERSSNVDSCASRHLTQHQWLDLLRYRLDLWDRSLTRTLLLPPS